MKIIFYCQHVLGIGHLFRSLEICKALSDHRVILVTGGPPVDISKPAHVSEYRLPELQMDQAFRGLFSSQQNVALDQIKMERQKRLYALFENENPDIFVIELYPFGRKAFRFELEPILHAIKEKSVSSCAVFSSVRDILVEKENQAKHEARVVKSLNSYFDAVLVHSDPRLFVLEETFDRFSEVKIPVAYTGFIAPKPVNESRAKIRNHLGIGENEKLIVVSTGSGSVGSLLLESVVKAFALLHLQSSCYLRVLTGPFIEKKKLDDLQNLTSDRVVVETFTSNFLAYLAGADLSISMAGYNTTMNILVARTPALVWPFPQNREQRMRAEKLADLGVLEVLRDQDLEPDHLAGAMALALSRHPPQALGFDLDGAANTAKWINTWAKRRIVS